MDFSVLLILHKWKLVIKQLHFLLVQFTVVRLYLCGSVSFWMCGNYKNSRQCISSQLHITEGPHQSSHVYLKQKGTPGTENEDFISSKAWTRNFKKCPTIGKHMFQVRKRVSWVFMMSDAACLRVSHENPVQQPGLSYCHHQPSHYMLHMSYWLVLKAYLFANMPLVPSPMFNFML